MPTPDRASGDGSASMEAAPFWNAPYRQPQERNGSCRGPKRVSSHPYPNAASRRRSGEAARRHRPPLSSSRVPAENVHAPSTLASPRLPSLRARSALFGARPPITSGSTSGKPRPAPSSRGALGYRSSSVLERSSTSSSSPSAAACAFVGRLAVRSWSERTRASPSGSAPPLREMLAHDSGRGSSSMLLHLKKRAGTACAAASTAVACCCNRGASTCRSASPASRRARWLTTCKRAASTGTICERSLPSG